MLKRRPLRLGKERPRQLTKLKLLLKKLKLLSHRVTLIRRAAKMPSLRTGPY